MTRAQAQLACRLLSYVAALLPSDPDAQLLAVVVAIRAARGGNGNLTGQDLRSLRLTDPAETVAALRGLGWQVPDQLIDGAPELPVAVTVPALAVEADHPLLCGKNPRSRVSGWTTRMLAAKPLRKSSPTVRLAALFLAAHASSTLDGTLPSDLPAACRAVLPELVERSFLAELSGDRYRLDAAVRHFAGATLVLPAPRSPAGSSPPRLKQVQPVRAHWTPPPLDPELWAQWKAEARPGLRRHAETVERCAICALPADHVASAFMSDPGSIPSASHLSVRYREWKVNHPGHGIQAARFTVDFRAEHGHGPSYGQLCAGLRWGTFRTLRTLIVSRLLADEWLTDTSPVPWTLRPGDAAQAQGVVLSTPQ
ncbi:hypothetical protein AB0D46_28860 [Streptomyces sp. NPDC048383]|uniref:hypothetical protein n=1 Tax=Streptomyces sp. NPDC048383 TaxID=3155386 RepID=UPI00343DAAA7